MNGNVAVSVRHLSKCYVLYEKPQDRLKHSLFRHLGKKYGREFWALKDISFDVHPGETFGIIGRNGSGKSTLLQMIAGTLMPTTGEIRVNGRVAALLELGSGFNPEFSGRENIFMNGAVMGISKKAMEERFDEIVSFADIGQFIDQPVKFYSSGMFIRLAFAVTTGLDADILLIDEALAVGDVFFRQKCYQRLEKLRERGVSILLVSHSMGDIEQFCRRALLLNHGEALFQGDASEAVKHYYLLEQNYLLGQKHFPQGLGEYPEVQKYQLDPKENSETGFFWPNAEYFLKIEKNRQVSNGWARCTAIALCNERGLACHVFRQGERAFFYIEYEILREIDVPIGGIVIQNDKGIIVHGKNTLQYGSLVPTMIPKGARIRFQQMIDLQIAPGEYTFEVGLATMSIYDYKNIEIYSHQEIDSKIVRLCHLPAAGQFAVTYQETGKRTPLMHHGVANLPGSCEVFVY